MKQLICELCGGNSFIKQEGVFVCQSCGCSYSLEEARKMMVEVEGGAAPGVAAAPAAPKVDNSAAIENYLNIARNAMEASNNEEAESYANKVIELDPQNSEAWVIKGEAAGWQSKTNNNRMGESVNAWINAVNFAKPEERFALRERIAGSYTGLLKAMIQLRCGNFANIQDKERLDALLNDLEKGRDMMTTLVCKAGVSFNCIPTFNDLARKMNSAACDGYKDAKNDFGPEHHNMAKWQWERFTGSCDNCITLLEKALDYCRDPELGKTICDNIVHIGEAARDSCSWKFEVDSWTYDHYIQDFSFTASAKEIRTKNIHKYNDKKNTLKKDYKSEALKMVRGDREAAEIEAAKVAYWTEHAAEKAALEAERAHIEKVNETNFTNMNNLPIAAQIRQTKDAISALTAQMNNLGLFKNKEKKELQAQIDGYNNNLAILQRNEEAAKEPFKAALTAGRNRLQEIEKELNRDCGRLSTEDMEKFRLPGAVAEGKFAITPAALAEHLSKAIPEPYRFKEITNTASSLTELGYQVELKFYRWNPEAEKEKDKEDTTGIGIHCVAADADSPMEAIVIEGFGNYDANKCVGESWCLFGSLIFMALFPDMTRQEAEEFVLDLRCTKDRTLWTRDDLRYEIVVDEWPFIGATSLRREMLLIRPKV